MCFGAFKNTFLMCFCEVAWFHSAYIRTYDDCRALVLVKYNIPGVQQNVLDVSFIVDKITSKIKPNTFGYQFRWYVKIKLLEYCFYDRERIVLGVFFYMMTSGMYKILFKVCLSLLNLVVENLIMLNFHTVFLGNFRPNEFMHCPSGTRNKVW